MKLSNVSFSGCGFSHCHAASLLFKNSSFNDTQLYKCTVYGISWGELMAAGAFSEPLSSVQDSRLRGNIFEGMSMRKFDFGGNSLLQCLFAESDIRDADFRSCDLDNTEFLRCDLRGADFRGAKGYVPDIFSCKMKGAMFSSPEVLSLLNGLEIKID